mgnify:CR=1 FL=1
MSEVHAQARTTPRTRTEIKESTATLAELAPSVQGNPLLAEAGRLVVIVESLNDGDPAASLAMRRLGRMTPATL